MISIQSCKKYELDEWPINYPKEVEKEVNLFIDNAPDWVVAKPLNIVLTNNIKSGGIIVCGLSSHDKKAIYLDTTSYSWKNSRTTLVLHELGHYVLNREHKSDTTTIFETWKGFPVSLMHPKTSKPTNWNLRREDLLNYYLHELFNPYKSKDG